jgi:chromosome segregation ATPase
MSWYVEGRLYHNQAEYQAAFARAEQRKVQRIADSLAAENRQLQNTIARDRTALDSVRDDVQKQMEISRRIQSNVNSLERNQQRVERALQESESRLQAGLAELEREVQSQAGRIHNVEVGIDELRSDHAKHLQDMREGFSTVRDEMRQGLGEAERKRKETEQILKSSLDELAKKVEDERQKRARQEADELALGRAEVDEARAALAGVDSKAESLALAGDLQQIRARLSAAETLLAQKNAGSALAVCTLARADADSLVHETRARRVELEETRAEVSRRLTAILDRVGAGANTDLKDCYGLECRRVEGMATEAKERLATRYRSYRLLPTEQHEDEQLLAQLETEAIEMAAATPLVVESATKRVAQVDIVLSTLEETYGQVTAVEQCFARAEDPKSDLILDATFGSSVVRATLGLDGGISVDAYGHSSASACGAAAQHILEKLERRMTVRELKTENSARSAPRAKIQVKGLS